MNELFKVRTEVRLAFKGGTSLSKIFRAIQRFSEDVDVTLNFKDLVLDPEIDPFDPGTSKAAIKRYSDQLKSALRSHVHEVIVPSLSTSLVALTGAWDMVTANDEGDLLHLHYPTAVTPQRNSLGSSVLIEFGGRNTTLPSGPYHVETIASFHIPSSIFPVADVMTLAPERTFWEKATLIHVECNRQRQVTPNRLSRHWYDLYKLGSNEIGQRAVADRPLLEDVVRVKKAFFNASYARYDDCLEHRFKLVPDSVLSAPLERDYLAMIDSGMFTSPPPTFQEIVDGLRQLEDSINRR
ncbi:MAG: nucleotidyl transferase AbiEii/AbiGii toxin family protein [Candidatus Hydrogenedentes bacterium]|nr:nucleotidyl transferase AbiEii/AbiGii toxin family protein [Candidatus Hydrogenedentota bacterium]